MGDVSYGHLTVIMGPMFAGKSTALLQRVLWARTGQGRYVQVFKPAIDDRYSSVEVVSHDGLRTEAISIVELPDIDVRPGSLVALDEVQFFESPHVAGDIVTWVKALLERGVDIVASGLDMDWTGRPFTPTASLGAMADTIEKVGAHCTICGRDAHKTHKVSASGGPVEIGGRESYEARCNKHWSR